MKQVVFLEASGALATVGLNRKSNHQSLSKSLIRTVALAGVVVGAIVSTTFVPGAADVASVVFVDSTNNQLCITSEASDLQVLLFMVLLYHMFVKVSEGDVSHISFFKFLNFFFQKN